MSLEKVVRPFQSGDPFTARRLTPVKQRATEDEEDVVVLWGDGISSTYTAFAVSGLVGGTVNYTEKSRVTSTQRIENPDDATQFVDVERIEKLTMANSQGNEIEFNLAASS